MPLDPNPWTVAGDRPRIDWMIVVGLLIERLNQFSALGYHVRLADEPDPEPGTPESKAVGILLGGPAPDPAGFDGVRSAAPHEPDRASATVDLAVVVPIKAEEGATRPSILALAGAWSRVMDSLHQRTLIDSGTGHRVCVRVGEVQPAEHDELGEIVMQGVALRLEVHRTPAVAGGTALKAPVV